MDGTGVRGEDEAEHEMGLGIFGFEPQGAAGGTGGIVELLQPELRGCQIGVVTTAFRQAVHGVLSGEYRVVEF